ncbi:hypothetical protein ACFVZD_45340 [Streptomyces sp. NPDC058287]|uniref:hypothetical protein n=1 Tax=unclassified Streptomyces TaxID=2593676 RepID=UPI0036E1008E
MSAELPPLPDVSTVVKSGASYVRDIVERVIATFVMTAASLLVTAGPADMFNLSFWQGVGVSGLAAVASLVKGIVARTVGEKNSASIVSGV